MEEDEKAKASVTIVETLERFISQGYVIVLQKTEHSGDTHVFLVHPVRENLSLFGKNLEHVIIEQMQRRS